MPSVLVEPLRCSGVKWGWLFIAGAVGGIAAACAMADSTERPRVIHSPHMTHYTLDNPQAVTVVDRKVVDHAAVVSNALSNQPVWPDKIELIVGDSTVYIDPTNEYTKRQILQLPDDHSLARAYRLWASIHTGSPARVVRGSTARPDPIDVSSIVPRMIIQKPGTMPQDGNPAPIPNVPKAPEREGVKAQVVSAERLD